MSVANDQRYGDRGISNSQVGGMPYRPGGLVIDQKEKVGTVGKLASIADPYGKSQAILALIPNAEKDYLEKRKSHVRRRWYMSASLEKLLLRFSPNAFP